jgi:hypothetical protein
MDPGGGLFRETRALDEIRIYLMKHGEFYHPAKVEVISGGECFKFVVNVGVSQSGVGQIRTEFENLKTLNGFYPDSLLPGVFELGGAESEDGRFIPMFLGEWFEGFHEFHYSIPSESKAPALRVWDENRGNYFLDSFRAMDVFAQASALLTAYYDFFSSCHIASWHHAAGDFVVKIGKEGLEVKLITVRQYAPLLKMTDPGLSDLLDGMVLYFLNLSIRMRLDRLDGVNTLFWIGDSAIQGMVKGFFSGLEYQVKHQRIPLEVVSGFKAYLGAFQLGLLADWFQDLVETLFRGRPEQELIRLHLKTHVEALHECLAGELRSQGL